MSPSTLLSAAGRSAAISLSAVSTAETQSLVEKITQVSMTELKPTSLPPTVIETSVVLALSAESWLLMTELVVAPLQASVTYDPGALALSHSAEYALALWSQDPSE